MSNDDESGLMGPKRTAASSGDVGWRSSGDVGMDGGRGTPGKRTATQNLPAADPATAWLGRLRSVQVALDGVNARYLPAMQSAIAAREMAEARRAGGELSTTLMRIDGDLATAKRWAVIAGSEGALALLAPLEAARDACRAEAAPVLALTPPDSAPLPLLAAFAPHAFDDEFAAHGADEERNRKVWLAKLDAAEGAAAQDSKAPAAGESVDNVIDASAMFGRERPTAESEDEAAVVQRRAAGVASLDPDHVQQAAAVGVAGSGTTLPHGDAIQRSFGAHDVTGISAHVGGAAADAAGAIGAEAYATGNHVAFAESPSLFVAAHEAAHVVQQRAGVSLLGGVGAAGDSYERHADSVAERVVRGESAEAALGEPATSIGGRGGVQRTPIASGFMFTADSPAKGHALSRVTPTGPAQTATDDARRELDMLQMLHLPAATVAYAAREFQRARETSNIVRISFARAEARLRDAKDALTQIGIFERETLLDSIAVVDARLAQVRPEVETVQRLAPKAVPQSMDCDDSMLVCQEMNASFEAEEQQLEKSWNTSLDVEAAARRAAAEGGLVVAPKDGVIRGIQLFVHAKHGLPKWFGMQNHLDVGPRGKVGSYSVMACIVDKEIAFFQAIHTKRHQSEWVIGTDSLDSFVANVDLFAGAARASLPGSANVEDSQEDGADKAPHLPSMLELEAFGVAPHQQFNLSDIPADGLDKGNGGTAAVSARNLHLRIEEYTKEAERLARQLKAQMDAGEIAHAVARTQAVDGRNELMRGVREKLSPAGGEASRKMKSDKGINLKEMTKRKTEDLLEASATPSTHAMDDLLGMPGSSADLRALLAEDHALWEQYRRAMEAGDDVTRVFSAAVQDLGAQPAVSRAIVHSAGKSNRTMTGVAKAGRVVAGAAAVYGMYDLVANISNAKEGEMLHVAGGEFGGFAGGIIGGELAAFWVASMITGPVGAPVVIVVTLLAGLVGGILGAEAGHALGGPLGESITNPGKAMQASLGPGAAQNGGYAGLYERSQRMGKGEGNLMFMLSNALWEMDEALAKVEKQIASAPDREKLETYQVMRLEVLENRDQLGFVYSALQSGQLSEAEVWQAIGGEPHAPN